MPYEVELAERIRELLATHKGVEEKAMFGGLAFLINGHLAVAASGQGGLMARVPPDDADALLQRPQVSAMVMRGRELRGWLRVDADALRTTRQLRSWVSRSADYARSLPPK